MVCLTCATIIYLSARPENRMKPALQIIICSWIIPNVYLYVETDVRDEFSVIAPI